MNQDSENEINDSYYIHILLEVYCSHGWNEEDNQQIPIFCKNGSGKPGYYCLENDCKFNTYTYADNEICYTGELGESTGSDSWVGFGGDMDPEDYDEEKTKKLHALWESICKKKIEEAYGEYMKLKSSIV